MDFVMSAGGVPAGTYRAAFLSCEPYTDNSDKYGAGVSLKWKILDGEHAGSEASRICSAKMSPKSTLAKFAVALKGGGIATNERFNFANYIGVTGNLIVEPTDSGGSRVSMFLRDAQPQMQDQQQPQAAPHLVASTPQQLRPQHPGVETF